MRTRTFGLQIEVVLRSGLDTIIQVAIIDRIQVHFHDLPLGILLCQTICQDSFLPFDLDITSLAHEELILYELLGDGTAAFNNCLVVQVRNSCS